MYQVGFCLVLCPCPCDGFVMYQLRTPPLAPSELHCPNAYHCHCDQGPLNRSYATRHGHWPYSKYPQHYDEPHRSIERYSSPRPTIDRLNGHRRMFPSDKGTGYPQSVSSQYRSSKLGLDFLPNRRINSDTSWLDLYPPNLRVSTRCECGSIQETVPPRGAFQIRAEVGAV